MTWTQQSQGKMPFVCREEGVAGLWRGIGPNVARNAIVNAAELATYDQVGWADAALIALESKLQSAELLLCDDRQVQCLWSW